MTFNRGLKAALPAMSLIWLASAANATDTEIVKYKEFTTSEPSSVVETRTTVERTPDNPVLIHDYVGGNSVIISHPNTTMTVEKRVIEQPAETTVETKIEKPVVIKKKKESHHLLHLGIPFVKANIL